MKNPNKRNLIPRYQQQRNMFDMGLFLGYVLKETYFKVTILNIKVTNF